MARKKKAETADLKASPVLRAGGGDDPTPETPVVTKSYCMRDDWKDKSITNYVAFKSVDGEVQDLTVNDEPAGGGGGGGTATVTITNASNDLSFQLEMPYVVDSQYTRGGSNTLFAGDNETFIIPLGSAGCHITFGSKGDFPNSGTGTGGVTYDNEEVYVTGDGTLSLS